MGGVARNCTACGEFKQPDAFRIGRNQCNPCRNKHDHAVKLAKKGIALDRGLTHETPEGFHVSKISNRYDADGELAGQWVQMLPEAQKRFDQLKEAIEVLAEPYKGLAKPVARPTMLDEDLLCVYPMGDPHVGMFSWRAETGNDFDLEIAERDLIEAVDKLVDTAPPAKQALIISLGDFFHSDNNSNRTTRSGHHLDVDTRWAKVLSVGVRCMQRIIDRALEKHEEVRVICEIGNHDDHSAVMLAICLDAYYHTEPRVTIDTSPSRFHWYHFGEVLIGVTHGDGCKIDKLPLIMANDQKDLWSATSHRFWYTGHVHHEQRREVGGVVIETFRTLAARDAYTHHAGYRSGRDMRCDVMHRTHGFITRHIMGLSQLIGYQK